MLLSLGQNPQVQPAPVGQYGFEYLPGTPEELDPNGLGQFIVQQAPTANSNQRLFLDPSLNYSYAVPQAAASEVPQPVQGGAVAGVGDTAAAPPAVTESQPATAFTSVPSPMANEDVGFTHASVAGIGNAEPEMLQTTAMAQPQTVSGLPEQTAVQPDYTSMSFDYAGYPVMSGIGDYAAMAQPQTATPANPMLSSYRQKMDAYAQQMREQGFEVREKPIWGPEGQDPYQVYAERDDPVANLFEIGLQFETNKGNPAKTKFNKSGVVWFDPETEYRLTNEKGKDSVVYQGKGLDALQKIYEFAGDLSEEGGKKANWGLEQFHPNDGQWRRVADDDPAKNVLGKIAKLALPVIGAFTPLGPIFGAMAGSALGGVVAGDSLKSILLSAGITGATAGVLKLTNADKILGGVLDKVPGVKQAAGALNSAVDSAWNTAFSGAIANGATTAAATAAANAAAAPIAESLVNDIVVMASNVGSSLASGIGGSVSSIFGPSTGGGTTQTQPQPTEQTPQTGIGGEAAVDPIVVNGTKVSEAYQLLQAGTDWDDPVWGNYNSAEIDAAVKRQQAYEQAQQDAAQQTGGDVPDQEIVVEGQRARELANMIANGVDYETTPQWRNASQAVRDAARELYANEFINEGASGPPGTTVTGQNPATGNAISGVGGAISGDIASSGSNANTADAATAGTGVITSTGGASTGTSDAATGGAGGVAGGITSTGQPTSTNDAVSGGAGGITSTGNPSQTGDGAGATAGEIVAEATRPTEDVSESPVDPEPEESTQPEDEEGGMGWQDWLRLALLAPGLIKGVFGGGGGGGGSVGDNGGALPVTTVGIGGDLKQRVPTFDPFTYGQAVPGAQQSEYLFFENLDKPLFQTQGATTSTGGGSTTPGATSGTASPYFTDEGGATYTQQQYEAANTAVRQQYNQRMDLMETYQDSLDSAVRSGRMTQAQAIAAAIRYARQIGLDVDEAAIPTGLAEGGKVAHEMNRHAEAFDKGLGHAGPGPVQGIGSGQEDLIPAWLSDGEYVWSAQDVSDLGDGSSDEGIRRLDQMREMVRRQAGRKNVKKIARPQRGIGELMKAVGGPV